MPRTRLPVVVLGATGVAGRQALEALGGHPWFEIVGVAASSRSAGRPLGDVVGGDSLPAALLELTLQDVDTLAPGEAAIAFSMLPSQTAARVEPRWAATTPVISTAATFRMQPDTPLLLAGVNGAHAELLRHQQTARGWRGWVAPGPNCTTVGLAVTLAPLYEAFGVEAASLTSMQAISGAGNAARGVAEAVERNVLPHIEGEEEKVEEEIGKILGRVDGGAVVPAGFPVSATCTRVAVDDGHSLAISVRLGRRVGVDEAAATLARCDPWRGRRLPSQPPTWIRVRTEPDRPQPRLDRDEGGGLTTVVGRLREDPVIGGLKYFVVTHNAVLGAAGGAVLLAEDLLERGWFEA